MFNKKRISEDVVADSQMTSTVFKLREEKVWLFILDNRCVCVCVCVCSDTSSEIRNEQMTHYYMRQYNFELFSLCQLVKKLKKTYIYIYIYIYIYTNLESPTFTLLMYHPSSQT